MANNLLSRPYIIDTASANPIKSGRVWTTGFIFRDYNNATDQAVVKDIRGLVIARIVGNAALSPVGEAWLHAQSIQNLAVTTLTSGVLEILVK